MSDEKREQLIAEGKLHPDGSRVERCPTCLRPFPRGEGMPTTTDDGEPVVHGAGQAEAHQAGVENPAAEQEG